MIYLDFANFPYIHEPIKPNNELFYIVKNNYNIWNNILNSNLYFELDLYITDDDLEEEDTLEIYFL